MDTSKDMTTNEIEEIVREFQKKFVREEKDPIIGGWHFKVWEHPMKIIDWLIPTLTAYGEKKYQEGINHSIDCRICKAIESSNH